MSKLEKSERALAQARQENHGLKAKIAELENALRKAVVLRSIGGIHSYSSRQTYGKPSFPTA